MKPLGLYEEQYERSNKVSAGLIVIIMIIVALAVVYSMGRSDGTRIERAKTEQAAKLEQRLRLTKGPGSYGSRPYEVTELKLLRHSDVQFDSGYTIEQMVKMGSIYLVPNDARDRTELIVRNTGDGNPNLFEK